MLSQVVLLDEFLATTWTAEWPFSSMDSFMLSQVIILETFLATTWTDEWLLIQSGSFQALLGRPSFFYEDGQNPIFSHQK